MKLSIERYFSTLNDFWDETNNILTDWKTPKTELVASCYKRIYSRACEVEKRQLSHEKPSDKFWGVMQHYEHSFFRNM